MALQFYPKLMDLSHLIYILTVALSSDPECAHTHYIIFKRTYLYNFFFKKIVDIIYKVIRTFFFISLHQGHVLQILNIMEHSSLFNLIYSFFKDYVSEAAKKVIFLVARPLRPLAPLLVFTLKKVFFSLVAHPFS